MDGARPLAADRRCCWCRWRCRASPSTALLSIILSLERSVLEHQPHRDARPRPLTAFIASFSSPEGLFWAKLSAASLLAIAPIVIFALLPVSRHMVRGLTMGATK